MSFYPRKIDCRANIDEIAPYFIERNEDYSAFRCCNRYYEILAAGPNQSPWYPMTPELWQILLNECYNRTSWQVQGNCIFLYKYTEANIRGKTGYKIVPLIEKQLRLLSKCFHEEYRFEHFDYAIGKSFPKLQM